MPFKSEKQKRLMYAAAKNKSVARRKGISQAVAKKFIADSKGKIKK